MEFPSFEAFAGAITTTRVVLFGLFTYWLAFGPSIPRVFGYSKLKYFHSNRSFKLKLKDGTTTTFDQLCKSAIPTCWLNPLLFNGHLQTIWTAISTPDVKVYYKRKVFEQEDPSFPGSFCLDFVVAPYEKTTDKELPPRTSHYTKEELETIGSNDSKPMLVALHGLSGGSHELYLREVLVRLMGEEAGWEACVVNSRGCAEAKITSNLLYNARSTWDLRQAVKWLRKTFPNRPLFGCGFSLGGNIITNYVGEEGEQCELTACLTLSNPWNLEIGSKVLRRTWVGLNIYSTSMGTSLKDLFFKHFDQLKNNAGIDIDAIKKLKYLHDFDYYVQGPVFGYPTAGAYYRDASSTDAMLNVRIPYLSINAEDDPIVSYEALPYEEVPETPYGVLCTSALGGHLSWFRWGGSRWFADAAVSWLQKMAKEVDLDSLPKPGDLSLNGHANGLQKGPLKQLKPIYAPVRKKWHIPEI